MNENAVPGAGEDERAGQVGQEVPVHRNLSRPEDSAADQGHPDRQHDPRSDPGDEQLGDPGQSQ
jgi:hypothetical protein